MITSNEEVVFLFFLVIFAGFPICPLDYWKTTLCGTVTRTAMFSRQDKVNFTGGSPHKCPTQQVNEGCKKNMGLGGGAQQAGEGHK